MHQALLQELRIRKGYLPEQKVETIYFGGGTPSLLSGGQIEEILDLVHGSFSVIDNPEITLEANPDDLTQEKLQSFKLAGINRLSIGVQSFDEKRLKYINRAHTSNEAKESIKMAFEAGFNNLTADLIYAIPPESMEEWTDDLTQMVALGPPHISLYGLTIEEKTTFGKWAATGRFTETSEEMAASQYRKAVEYLTQSGYVQYEVSNFAKPGFESKHNSAYWAGGHYLGIGPGAHSYNGHCRSYNISQNSHYISAISQGNMPETIEELSQVQLLNESILTGLRTKKGIDLKFIFEKWEVDLLKSKSNEIARICESGLAIIKDGHLKLTTDGFMVADDIALRLFYEE